MTLPAPRIATSWCRTTRTAAAAEAAAGKQSGVGSGGAPLRGRLAAGAVGRRRRGLRRGRERRVRRATAMGAGRRSVAEGPGPRRCSSWRRCAARLRGSESGAGWAVDLTATAAAAAAAATRAMEAKPTTLVRSSMVTSSKLCPPLVASSSVLKGGSWVAVAQKRGFLAGAAAGLGTVEADLLWWVPSS